MLIYKFGGVSVKTASAIKNIAQIINKEQNKLIVVVSAMGKMTNKFETLINAYVNSNSNSSIILDEIKQFHFNIINNLFNSNNEVYSKVNLIFNDIETILTQKPSTNFDFEYDKIIVYAEIISTTIISEYFNKINISNTWLDIRKSIITDSFYTDGKVNWEQTEINITNNFKFKNSNLIITQGFIASDEKGNSVTLGREGSDYTASIIGFCLNAQNVTIWKDVPGILNADPRIFDNTVKIDELNYKETVELAYYGAQIIHPKTVKPLQNKNIPLYVKSFINSNTKGTVISNKKQIKIEKPIIIIKKNQVLISISPKDFSFIDEKNISKIFKQLAAQKIKVNLMENSAIKFSILIDNSNKIDIFIAKLKEYYLIKYNTGLELITIRHYNNVTINELLLNKTILVEQKTRYTALFVVK